MSTSNSTPAPAGVRTPHPEPSQPHDGITHPRRHLPAALRRACSTAVLGIGLVAIVSASAIGLNDWADAHATSTSMHEGSWQLLDQ